MTAVILVVANSRRRELEGVFPESVLVTSIGEGLAGTRADAVVVAIGEEEYCSGSECRTAHWAAEIETLKLKLNNGGKMIFLAGIGEMNTIADRLAEALRGLLDRENGQDSETLAATWDTARITLAEYEAHAATLEAGRAVHNQQMAAYASGFTPDPGATK